MLAVPTAPDGTHSVSNYRLDLQNPADPYRLDVQITDQWYRVQTQCLSDVLTLVGVLHNPPVVVIDSWIVGRET
ncbi:hypothetical protein E7T06_00235 [Deinococcus sp. Arct2-2]|uniref:hypothetical protein n=1 Tax=Deinococcus sp. Arct2-2 TaxID=2568653 RepID=UPI0010A460FC|nr:hypothetical protein [Deinococcus sp. Arct2-2]THF71843.1 hypothetical protein E7T06_00235 [Deinococcus sp. Arct2-2]